jgi:transglutaminase superfamily protein
VNYWSQPPSWLERIGDALLVVHVALLAAIVPVIMRLPLDRVRTFLEPHSVQPEVNPTRQQRVLDLVNMVVEKGRPVFRTTCLTRGVARYYFLRRAGVDVALAFGIGRATQTGATGHCWLVKGGEPYLEGQDPRPHFAEVFRIAAC